MFWRSIVVRNRILDRTVAAKKVRDVVELARIDLHIEELRRLINVIHVLVTRLPDHVHGSGRIVRVVLRKDHSWASRLGGKREEGYPG